MLKSLPNILTIFRILLIIPILVLLYIPDTWAVWTAFGLYVLASITDFFDGYLARKLQVVSNFGKFLDPIADKLLIVALVITFVDTGLINGIWVLAAIVILLREILVSGLREYLGPYNVTLPVTVLAKWKTTLQMVALGTMMISTQLFQSVEPGLHLFGLAALVTFITGWDYLSKGINAMKELGEK